jgi:hypothetical protein
MVNMDNHSSKQNKQTSTKQKKQTFKKIGRRAESQWIAYVLIMGFVVSLSVVMFSFMTDYTRSSAKNIKKTIFNTEECQSVSLSIESACFSSQVLNITLQNRNYLRIDKLDFRLYDLNNKPVGLNVTNVTMNPNRQKVVTINTGLDNLGYLEVIPIVFKQDPDGLFEIVCGDRKASTKSFNSSC